MSISTMLFLLEEVLDEQIVGFSACEFSVSLRIGRHGIAWEPFRCMIQISTPWIWANFHFRHWPKEDSKRLDKPEWFRNFDWFSVMWSKYPIGLTA